MDFLYRYVYAYEINARLIGEVYGFDAFADRSKMLKVIKTVHNEIRETGINVHFAIGTRIKHIDNEDDTVTLIIFDHHHDEARLREKVANHTTPAEFAPYSNILIGPDVYKSSA